MWIGLLTISLSDIGPILRMLRFTSTRVGGPRIRTLVKFVNIVSIQHCMGINIPNSFVN